MVLLAVILFVLAVLGGVASHVLAHAARQVADDRPEGLPFSALIGWAAFCQAVFLCFLVSGALFLIAHALGWH